jgi:hypothetical protein
MQNIYSKGFGYDNTYAPYTSYVVWLKDTYGQTGLEKFWDTAEKFIYNPDSSPLDNLQNALNFGGMVPVFGEPIDGVNGIIYYIRGDKVNAALSAGSMIPFIGNGVAGAKIVKNGANVFKDAVNVANGIKKFEQVMDKVETYEQARNKAFNIIGDLGADSKPYIGRLGTGEANIVGRQSADGKVRWRLDYDPNKGAHINIEDYRSRKGSNAIKIAIPFNGDMNTVESLLKHLNK